MIVDVLFRFFSDAPSRSAVMCVAKNQKLSFKPAPLPSPCSRYFGDVRGTSVRDSIPCRPSVWVVAQLAEHRTVTAAREGSTPFDPPKHFRFSIANCRLTEMPKGLGLQKPKIRKTEDQRPKTEEEIGNRQLAIENPWNCGREVRHLVVNQADDGSSPFSSAMRQ